jgi:hypothetical protein
MKQVRSTKTSDECAFKRSQGSIDSPTIERRYARAIDMREIVSFARNFRVLCHPHIHISLIQRHRDIVANTESLIACGCSATVTNRSVDYVPYLFGTFWSQ